MPDVNIMFSFFFRTYIDDFARIMMTDAQMVKLMEGCNFCVPSSEVYLGQSYFYRKTSDPNPPNLPPRKSMLRTASNKNF